MLEQLSDEQRGKFERLAELLVEGNKRMNLTRIVEAEEIPVRHFEDSLVILDKLREMEAEAGRAGSLVDLGSGAGFPGLALAIALPTWRVVSVESTGKKAGFQREVVEELELANTEVVNGRAEELAHEGRMHERFDAVTVRAVGVLSIGAELGMGFLRVGGRFFAWKGKRVKQEWEAGEKALRKMGAGKIDIWRYQIGQEKCDFRILEAVKNKHTPTTYPRQFKVIKAEADR